MMYQRFQKTNVNQYFNNIKNQKKIISIKFLNINQKKKSNYIFK